jgi:hypothetical protein
MPGAAALALLVLVCGVVGATAGGPRNHGVLSLIGYLCGGQLIGHVVLAFASGHLHALDAAPKMMLSHVAAAVLCALLIAAAERLCVAAATQVWRLVRTLTDAVGPSSLAGRTWWQRREYAVRILLWCTAGIRGPPVALS